MATIVVNFKNYVHGEKCLSLARKIEKFLPRAIVCVPALDANEIARRTKLRVFTQHVDLVEKSERATGFLTVESVKSSRATGSLVNHSEHRLEKKQIYATIKELNANKIKTIVCVPDLRTAKEFSSLDVDYIAFEDSNLISTGKSITDYRSEDLKKFVLLMKGKMAKALCGAGVSTALDVRAALDFGCEGVLIASAIAASRRPAKLLSEIARVI